jgi:2-polyprenyl-6-methoxyphenol hydroxylase-like FAD-dependent oxidoreductase
MRDQGGRVSVSFAKGPDRDFDVVVAADGVRSRTRGLFLGPEDGCGDRDLMKPLDIYLSFFTIPRGGSDCEWGRWCHVPGQRFILLRPDRQGTTRAALAFMSPSQGWEHGGQEEQKEAVGRIFADAGWETPRVLEGMWSSPDFYMDFLVQVGVSDAAMGERCLSSRDVATIKKHTDIRSHHRGAYTNRAYSFLPMLSATMPVPPTYQVSCKL